jgi:hypothetical protein
MKYLINTVETYRVDTEEEANRLIDDAKSAGNLSKYSCVYKERKAKGEVIDDWYRVTLTKVFTDEKEPEYCVSVHYEG